LHPRLSAMPDTLNVIFAPDWRNGVPYQELLARALERHNVNVTFLGDYKRILPLSRLLKKRQFDVLHLHWPEAYYPTKGDAFDWFRRARFPFDLLGAAKRGVLVATAHNFHAHDRANETFAERNVRCVHENAKVVFAHSDCAKQRLVEWLGVPAEKVRVAPHGDLSVALGPPLSAAKARCELGLGHKKVALIFGAVERYKGLEEVIAWWRSAQPNVRLAIVGKPNTAEYGAQISSQIGQDQNVIHYFGWLSNEILRLWLSAADVIVFNYREVFTSGAASLARSFGIPILLPRRLDTIDVGEPTPYVRRFTDFGTDFEQQLASALTVKPDFAAAESWREDCNWDNVARTVVDGYRSAIG